MKKHKVLLDLIKDSITFSLGYYMHLGVSLSPIPPKPEGTKTIPKIRQQDIFLNRILKKGLDENLDNFLKTS